MKWHFSSRRGKPATALCAVVTTSSLVALGCTAAALVETTPTSSMFIAGAKLVASAPVLVGLQSGTVAGPADDPDRYSVAGSALLVRRPANGRSSEPAPARHHKPPPSAPTTVSGLPVPALRAYKHAASVMASTQPSCGLQWYVLAGIGMAESDHGRFGGSVIAATARSVPRIVGPVLNGQGAVAAIGDSDGGRLDGDKVWDRAVGPMQFIPQTWAAMAADGDGDGVSDPNDLDDAALAAAAYLCRSGGNLADDGALATAIRTYNNSAAYVILVMAYADAYRRGAYPTVPAGLVGHLDGPDRPVTPKPQGHKDKDKGKASDKPKRPHGDDKGSGGGGHEGSDSPRPQPEPPKPAKPEPPKPSRPEPPKPAKPPTPEPPKPPKTPKPPVPVTKTVLLTGVPAMCGDSDWCVQGAYAGDLAAWTVADYDGDCLTKSMTSELQGLAAIGVSVQVTVAQTSVAGEVTETVTKEFLVVDPPTCDKARETTAPPDQD